MSRATFESKFNEEKPTHYIGKNSGWVYWKVAGRGYQMSPAGVPLMFDGDPINNRPSSYEPRYGNLVITISPED